MSEWKNYPTRLWAERLANPAWRDDVVAAARAARTLDGFRFANLAALEPPTELHDWAEQWVDWPALWRHFKGGAKRRDERPQAFRRKEAA